MNTFGIYFIVGWLVGADAAKLYYWRRRAKKADERLQSLIAEQLLP